jgi:hypothetical protein
MRDIVGNIYSQRSLHSIQRWDNCIARLHGMRQVATDRIIVAFLGRSGLADACVVEMGRPAGTEACLLKTASNQRHRRSAHSEHLSEEILGEWNQVAVNVIARL